MNRLTGHEPKIYQCNNPKCGDISTDKALGEALADDMGSTEQFCTSCNSRNISQIIEGVTE